MRIDAGSRCGLGGENRSAVGREVLKAVKGTAGVKEVVLNRSVARLAVTVDAGGPTPQELCRVVAEAERSVNPGVSNARQRPLSLPGDDVMLLARTAAATVARPGSARRDRQRPCACGGCQKRCRRHRP